VCMVSGSFLKKTVLVMGSMIVLLSSGAFALNDGQALTPPLGWNSWNWFGCSDRSHGTISTQMMIQMGRAMVTSGMRDSGYRYINIDDCWAEYNRDSRGGLVSIKAQFPSIKVLADSIHAMGLKLGIYTDLWEYTCAQQYGGNGLPGLYNREQQDADTFVAWGIDYIKIDYCMHEGHPEVNVSDPVARRTASAKQYSKAKNAFKTAYEKALAAGKNPRPIVISVCEWGENNPYLWADTVGHLWRISTDIQISSSSFMSQVQTALGLSRYAGPGHWNDPDMMQVGNGLSANQDRVHFGLWCLLAAPLIAGNDLRSMNAATKELLTNGEAIAVNQDSLGHQAVSVSATSTALVVAKKMKDGSYAVGLINKGTSAATISVTWAQLATALGVTIPSTESFQLRNILGRTDLGTISNTYSTSVPTWDIFMFRMYPLSGALQATASPLRVPVISFNRARSVLSVSVATEGQVSFKLVNVLGKTVRAMEINASGNREISTKGMAQGLYFIRLQSRSNSVAERIMID
jgi:alpha-galactosidase